MHITDGVNIGVWPGFGSQPCYKAPGELWVEISKTDNIKLVRLPHKQWPKVGYGADK